ncbi:MAG: S-layer homology domain-containing protein [Acidimicrobiia bacterium]|nr:S-layer homology domain-containing protein [Acidimicrobiia bacterium]
MFQRLSRLSKGWAVLAAGALVASLLAVNATSATATTDTPDERSNLTACLGEALTDWGFTDVPDTHVFHDSINCLAHYGITIGTGDGSTFSPEDPVKRWQMMLFLARALGPANINHSRARAQNFTDLGNLNDEARDAIDLLVTNGIATPASNRTFDPEGIVDRTEMALLLVNFLDAAGPVVDFDTNGDILLDANDDGSQSQPDDYFQDARDLVPVAADRAISAAYELGITTGVDPTPAAGSAQPGLDLYYRPRGSVTRGQMAAFIIRSLAHTLARPTGLSAQYDGSEIRVSVREDDFEPVVDAPIDMFFIETEDANRAFTSRGDCSDVDFVDGTYLCEIDFSDPTTDDDGEVSLTVPQLILDGTDTTVWVWTGREGDEFDRRMATRRGGADRGDRHRRWRH